MADIVVACDEAAATQLLHQAQAAIGTISKNGAGSLGPFQTAWNASASLANGTINLNPANEVDVRDCDLNYNLSFGFTFDLSSIIPDFCLPQICVDLPFNLGRICTPTVCVDWPSVTINIPYSDRLRFSADCALVARQEGSTWLVEAVLLQVPVLQISPGAAAILVALGLTAAAIMAPIPFIGPFLSGAVAAIVAAIGIAGVSGLLGPILTLFVSGLTFTLFKQERRFQLLPSASALEPPVFITLDQIVPSVQRSEEDELLISVDVS
jgi:hypothetical protein